MQSLRLSLQGLYTAPNQLSSVPDGALLVADNIDINSDNLAEPRRGFDRLSDSFSNSADRADALFNYDGYLFAHNGVLGDADILSYYKSDVWNNLSGSYLAPTGYKIKTTESNQNLFFTTSAGVYKMDNYDSTPAIAGAPKFIDLELALTGTSGFLTDTYYTAYRGLWGKLDNNNNLILGAPSSRAIIQNTAGSSATRNVSITLRITEGVTTSHLFQIYRSVEIATSEPSDELQLVYEGYPTAGDITAGYITITDIVPDALRGASLYTNPSQEGLANSNYRLPIARDLAVFRNCAFYANTTANLMLTATLLATGATDGLQIDDTVTVGGQVYTAKASETVASAEFKVYTGGSVAQDVRDTCLSLARVVSQYSSGILYATYISGPNDTPGQLLFELRTLGLFTTFTFTSSRTTAWNSTTTLPVSATAESYLNGLYWSKPNQPEAVPLVNFAQVGSKGNAIKRIVPLRDSLIIFKEEGIYRLTGFYPNFSVELLDSSAKIIGPDTAVVLNNQVFALSDQGIIVVSDGVKIISRPIETTLLELFASHIDLIRTTAFAVAYETERKYMLYLPTASSDTYCKEAYVYNVFTNSFTKHIYDTSCASVFNNHLYYADASSNYVLEDRKSYTNLDYADYGFTTSIDSISSSDLVLNSGIDEVTVGDIVYQSSTIFANVTAINLATSTVTVNSDPGFTVAACTILNGIDTKITWNTISSENPGVLKQYHTAELMFKNDFIGTGYLSFSSDLSVVSETTTIQGSGSGLWGMFDWGEEVWGGENFKRLIRQWVPRNKQRCSQLEITFSHNWAYSGWKLHGLTVFATAGSERAVR